ncbi:MAG: hypothetical protein ACFB02_08045 [Mastigocoleus sp.]
MNNSTDTCLITDPEKLSYISRIVNQLLESRNDFYDIKDLQAALKEISLENGQEIQINLIFEENQLTGFNFSFSDDPTRTTLAIPFQQKQVSLNDLHSSTNIESEKGDIIVAKQTIVTITEQSESNLTNYSSLSQEIVLTPGLEVEDQRIINPSASKENQTTLKSSFSGQENLNSGLVNVANKLTNQQEINGLLFTGLSLKTGVSLADTLRTEEKPDFHTAGLSIIKRFEQILPEEFIEFKSGEIPKSFNWKDPHSNKQYRFCFETAQTSPEGEILVPASLKGFNKISDSNLQQVFAANLIDSKYNRWSIEQCDFSKNQIQSLGLATINPSHNNLTTSIDTVSDFSY